MNTMRPFFLGAIFFILTHGVYADYPPLLSNTETQPPTADDEAWRAWRRLERCHHCLDPITIPQSVVVYPCAPDPSCGNAVHVSSNGEYGSIHPAPYYLPTPRIAVHDVKLCPSCRKRSELAVEIIIATDSPNPLISPVPRESVAFQLDDAIGDPLSDKKGLPDFHAGSRDHE